MFLKPSASNPLLSSLLHREVSAPPPNFPSSGSRHYLFPLHLHSLFSPLLQPNPRPPPPAIPSLIYTASNAFLGLPVPAPATPVARALAPMQANGAIFSDILLRQTTIKPSYSIISSKPQSVPVRATADPVAHFSFNGCWIKANSLTRFATSSSNLGFSSVPV